MSRESSLVPTNLLEWPRVRSMLPEQKFIFQSLWSSPFINSVGVGELPLLGFSAALSICPDAVLTGINNLVDAKLVKYEEETNEIFIVDWFRFHKFKKFGIDIANREIQKVRSATLKKLILEKSNSCLPTLSPSPSPDSPPYGGGSRGEFRKSDLRDFNGNDQNQSLPLPPEGGGGIKSGDFPSVSIDEDGELEWPAGLDEAERDQVLVEWKMVDNPQCQLQHAIDEVRVVISDQTRQVPVYSPARWIAGVGRKGLTRTPAGRKFEDARKRVKHPQEAVTPVFDKIDLELGRKKLADLKAVINIHPT